MQKHVLYGFSGSRFHQNQDCWSKPNTQDCYHTGLLLFFFSFLRSRDVITAIREELGQMFLRTKQRNENRWKFLYHCVQANFATWIFRWTEQQSPVSEWRIILQRNIYRSWWLEKVHVKQNYHALCWKQICWLKLWCTNYVIFALISCWNTLYN